LYQGKEQGPPQILPRDGDKRARKKVEGEVPAEKRKQLQEHPKRNGHQAENADTTTLWGNRMK